MARNLEDDLNEKIDRAILEEAQKPRRERMSVEAVLSASLLKGASTSRVGNLHSRTTATSWVGRRKP